MVLRRIEETCWEGNLASSEAVLRKRFDNHRTGQWVAVVDNQVVGLMFTQRVASEAALLGSDWQSHTSLHEADGPLLQLLGVAVLPAYRHLQVGRILRNLVLHTARLDASIRGVVAMTRCASFDPSRGAQGCRDLDELYEQYVVQNTDRGVKFHLSAGAELVQVAKDYRPSDTRNLGHAVLVRYPGDYSQLGEPVTTTEARGSLAEDSLSFDIIRMLLAGISEQAQHTCTLDSPFMSLGLDSLQMLELCALLQPYSLEKLPSIFLFNYPTPRSVLTYLARNPFEKCLASEPVLSSAAASSGPVRIAIVGMSCRLPGGPNPAEFWHSLLQGTDSVRPVPSAWRKEVTGVGVAAAGFLDDDMLGFGT